ncbi:hypothetical protein DFQ27_008595 [Actinomortierella ambigua]|uniref:DUF4142 domain-containing protein n=1 Tax=Actinomortierella ambigua TaxID=1343610 RepID=A0A9P6PSC2_9FUNG|nr:hypothetical protein DFQ27_008595 [Actinomortierella ambigua]
MSTRVFTTYLENGYGEFAQSTHKNRKLIAEYSELTATPLPPRCSSWLARSLMEPYAMLPSKALYDLYTAKLRHAPSSPSSSPSSSSSRPSLRLYRQFRRDSHLKACSNRAEAGGNSTVLPGEDICIPIPKNVTDNETIATEWGPMTAIDRDLIRKVRLTSLWELPIASEALTRSKSSKIRQISAKIQEQHEFLDAAVLSIAKQLNVQLPNGPSSEQACWMCEIRAAQTDKEHDDSFVRRLRFAHGLIFSTIATVRGTTQNTAVRSFAETANLFVLGHMQLLESTGLVAANSFPVPPPVNLVK